MKSLKFEDIEVGDIVTVERLSNQDHMNPTITGEVDYVDHEAVLLTIYIFGISQPVCSDNHTLVNIKKKPLVFPEVGRPIKIWNADWEKTTTCYGFWDGKSYTGTTCGPVSGEVKQLTWDIDSIESPSSIRWEYIDGGD